jgi:hypothetical protein
MLRGQRGGWPPRLFGIGRTLVCFELGTLEHELGLGASTTPNPPTADAPSVVWAVDFQFDATTDGRPIKIVSIVGVARPFSPGFVLVRFDRTRGANLRLSRVHPADSFRTLPEHDPRRVPEQVRAGLRQLLSHPRGQIDTGCCGHRRAPRSARRRSKPPTQQT